MAQEYETLLKILGVIATLIIVYKYAAAFIHFIERQKKQDTEIKSIKEEQSILTLGVLACLKGLKEQGCDGPVTEAISSIEKHLNAKAHG